MINILKFFCLITIILYLNNCSENIKYSGKIIKDSNINYNKLNDKNDIITNLGNPSFIDPIEKKYYYFSEKLVSKNFFNKKLDNRTLIVFNFDDLDKVIEVNEFNLDDEKEIKIVKETTENNIIEQGLIEKIFGGVGASPAQTPQ